MADGAKSTKKAPAKGLGEAKVKSTDSRGGAARSQAFPLPEGHYYSVPFTARSAHSGRVEDQAAIRAIQEKVGAPVTGVFGGDTEGLVRVAQAKAHLPVSGVVDEGTWKALFR